MLAGFKFRGQASRPQASNSGVRLQASGFKFRRQASRFSCSGVRPITRQSFLADQLRRSSSSIGLNFAEGYYQPSSKQVRRYFVYAIQSARETSMALDIAGAFDLAPADQVRRGKGLCLEIVKMMSKLGQLSRKPAG